MLTRIAKSEPPQSLPHFSPLTGPFPSVQSYWGGASTSIDFWIVFGMPIALHAASKAAW